MEGGENYVTSETRTSKGKNFCGNQDKDKPGKKITSKIIQKDIKGIGQRILHQFAFLTSRNWSSGGSHSCFGFKSVILRLRKEKKKNMRHRHKQAECLELS